MDQLQIERLLFLGTCGLIAVCMAGGAFAFIYAFAVVVKFIANA